MKNFNELSRGQRIANWFIKLFAAVVVKLFPQWALRFTVKTNPNAKYFLLPAKAEKELLEKMVPEEITKHLWTPQTRKDFLGSEYVDIRREFAKDLVSGTEFDILLEKSDHMAIKSVLLMKKYTPNQDQVSTIFKKFENVIDVIKVLVVNQPSTISAAIWRGIPNKLRIDVLKNFPRNLSGLEPLIEAVVWSSFSDNACKEDIISFLTCYREQIPAKAETIAKLQKSYPTVFEKWYRSKAKEDVAILCLQRWCETENWDWIDTLKLDASLKVLGMIAESLLQNRTKMKLNNEEKYTKVWNYLVSTLLLSKYACPRILHVLEDDNFKQMLELCLTRDFVSNIPMSAVSKMDMTELKRCCILLAEMEKTNQSLLDKLSEEDREEVMKTYEDVAYIKWLVNNRDIEPNVQIFKKMTLSGKVQRGILGRTYGDTWLSIYMIDHTLEDETLKEMIRQNKTELLTLYLRYKNPISKAVKDALLFSEYNDWVAKYNL